jgi:enediyne biosynthesis protein E4
MVVGAVLVLVAGVGSAFVLRPWAGRALEPPHFVDEASAAGVDHRYDGEFTHFVGGGVAAFDCDDDGFADLYFAGGSQPAALYRNASVVGGPLSFAHLPSPVTDIGEVSGAYPLDVDGDAIVDLAVLRVGEDVMLRGLGDCAFERANERWGVDGGDTWTAAFAATWEDGETLPTLAFGDYLDFEADAEPPYDCLPNVLLRPDGPDGYGERSALEPGWCSLSLLFSDWSGTGRRDLRVSNDRHYYRDGEEQLWRIAPGEAPVLWTAGDGWRTTRIFGMGIASRDLTGDGRPEVYLTSQADNKLQTLVADADGPVYEDIALERGVTAHRPHAGDTTMPSTAWHPEFADVNNDGFVDLFVSKGNVEAMTEYAARDPSNLLIGQADGTFVEGAGDAGITDFARARGAALVDLNLDGLLDLVVVNRREPVRLWRNTGDSDGTESAPMGHWLAVRLSQPEDANRNAIGAWLEIRAGDRTQRIELTVGGGHAGGQLGWMHVGLGAEERAEIVVTWPDGTASQRLTAAADTFVIVERGASAVETWTPEEDR